MDVICRKHVHKIMSIRILTEVLTYSIRASDAVFICMFLFGLVQCVVKLRLIEIDEKWLWILYLKPEL